MKIIFVSIILAFCFSVNAADSQKAATSGAEISKEELLKSIQSAWDAMKTYQADFKLSRTSFGLGRTRETTGHLAIKKPNQILWVQKDGGRQILDGNNFKVIVPKKAGGNRVEEETDIKKVGDIGFLKFLSGEGKLAAAYETKIVRQSALSVSLELKPKEAVGSPETYVAEFDKKGYTLLALITKAVGTQSKVEFSKVKLNEGLKEDFSYKMAPKDTWIRDGKIVQK